MFNKDFIKEIKENPELLDGITPREFEELIAEILSGLDWKVNLTSTTRDGGYDLLAIKEDITGLESTWVIECKKYRPFNKVGVDILRSAYGVKNHLGVSNALIITSSTFTRDSIEFAENKYDLHLVDRDGVIKWLSSYSIPEDDVSYFESKRFYSCFISYSHKDEEFAEKLSANLRKNGIKVWYAPEDMLPGQKIHEQIKKAIKQFDKLLVVLSSNSMNSEWVKSEIRNARKREIDDKCQILFPVSIASIQELKEWECFDADVGKDIAVELREYLIPIFTNWQDNKSFEFQLHKVLQGLSFADKSRNERIDTMKEFDISGSWKDEADNDVAYFRQLGNRVIGFYNFDGRNHKVGIYYGYIRERIFEYNWKWLNGNFEGQGRMIISTKGNKMSGEWWYENYKQEISHVGYTRMSKDMPKWINESDFQKYKEYWGA